MMDITSTPHSRIGLVIFNGVSTRKIIASHGANCVVEITPLSVAGQEENGVAFSIMFTFASSLYYLGTYLYIKIYGLCPTFVACVCVIMCMPIQEERKVVIVEKKSFVAFFGNVVGVDSSGTTKLGDFSIACCVHTTHPLVSKQTHLQSANPPGVVDMPLETQQYVFMGSPTFFNDYFFSFMMTLKNRNT
jgi:hypothetical protein